MRVVCLANGSHAAGEFHDVGTLRLRRVKRVLLRSEAGEGLRAARGVLNSVQASPRPKPEDRRPKEGRNPNCRIRSHRRGATAHRIQPFSDFGIRPSFGLRSSGFGFQSCDPSLEQPSRVAGSSFYSLHRRGFVARSSGRSGEEIDFRRRSNACSGLFKLGIVSKPPTSR